MPADRETLRREPDDGPTCYIVDMRTEWARKPYITVWRPDDCGYAFPLAWAGRYAWSRIESQGSYYATRQGTEEWKRFPVPCEVVEGLAIPKPKPGTIDGDTGPVLVNNAKIRAALRAAKRLPLSVTARCRALAQPPAEGREHG